MQNFKATGDILPVVAPYALASGDGCQVGALFGVATDAAAISATVNLNTEGVFEVTKTSAQAWTVGQRIYWDNTNKRADSDGTLGMLIGVATVVAANPSSTGVIVLVDAPAALTGPQATIAAVSTANATDLASVITLANQLKVSLNLVIASLKLSGQVL